MSARHWWQTSAAVATVVAAVAGGAWAQTNGAERVCGTRAVTPLPTGNGEAGGRVATGGRVQTVANGGLGLAVPLSPLPTVVEVPTGSPQLPAAPVLPSAPTPVVGSTPPTPAAPPAVPGLPPPPDNSKKKKDEARSIVEAIQAKGEVPEERLLDVGIAVFDPGLDKDAQEHLAALGLTPELRRAEGRFVAFHLKKTMEGTGNWGAVRMLPGPGEGLDVFVSGRIVQSTGKTLALDVEATDSTGRRWLRGRYKGEADLTAYRPDRVGHYEPFQEVYNRIANDLLARRDELAAADIVALHRVASLRFGAQLAPEAFAPFLKSDGGGHYALLRLPAEGDPMVRRVANVRDRDQMLVDTLNDYYLSFYERMGSHYSTWRQYSYQEQEALDKIHRESTLKKILGGAGMIAGVIMSGSNSQSGRLAGDLAMLGGLAALQAGSQQAQEKSVHVAALKELANAADGEVAPLLVEVEGQQLKLTGSAEKQFSEWRELLGRVFTVETAVPGDPNAPVVVTVPPSR